MDAESFSHSITSAYAETVHWHRHLFLVPSGKAGTFFVTLLANLFRAYGQGSSLESIALRAAMVTCDASTSIAETPCKIQNL